MVRVTSRGLRAMADETLAEFHSRLHLYYSLKPISALVNSHELTVREIVRRGLKHPSSRLGEGLDEGGVRV